MPGDLKFTTANGSLFIQPDGPGGALFWLGCHDVGDIDAPLGETEIDQCRRADGSGFDVIGETQAPPEKISTEISAMTFKERSYLEKINGSFALYIAQGKRCGRRDSFSSYDRMLILHHARKTGMTITAPVDHNEDSIDTERTFPVSAWPPLIEAVTLTAEKRGTSETEALNDITGALETDCTDPYTSVVLPCQNLIAVGDSAVAPAKGAVLLSADSGATWTAAAALPGVAGKNLLSVVRVLVGRSTVRIIVAQEFTVAGQGIVAYSDDNGATWTTVNIGGAAAAHGAAMQGALFAAGYDFIVLAGAAGYIYKSTDGGATWTAKESGIIHVGAYNAVTFNNGKRGIAVGAAGIVARTYDGGNTWSAATTIAGGAALQTVAMTDNNTIFVGASDGKVWRSVDFGTTWTNITTLGTSVKDIAAVNQFVLFVTSTAAAVGHLYRTINGGATFEEWTMPTNAGLNALWKCSENKVFAVGEPSGGTAVIVDVHEI